MTRIHHASGFEFAAISGGSFDMGLSEQDILDASERMDWSSGVAQWAETMQRCASPVHAVAVAPFLCALRPIWTPDELQRCGFEDAFVSRETALELARALGLRLLSEAEFEWIGRDGGASRMIANAGERYSAMKGHGKRPRPESRFGLTQLDLPHWVRDDWHPSYEGAPSVSVPWLKGDPVGVHRSGFMFVAMQSPEELLFSLAGARFRGDQKCVVRLAMDLPGERAV